MPARKAIDIATTKFTATLTAGVDTIITYAKVTNAAGTVERIKPTQLVSPMTFKAGQRAEIKDDMIALINDVTSAMPDAQFKLFVDDATIGFKNDDVIVWMTSATVVATARLAPTSIAPDTWATTVIS